jgi:HK97 family phage major capsid protein
MKRSDELRQKRAEVVEQMTALHRSAGSDSFTEEQTTKWNDLNKKAEDLAASIEREEMIEAEELRMANDAAKKRSNEDVRRVVTKESEEVRAAKDFRLIGQDGAINQLLTRGRLEGLAAEVHEEGTREARQAGLNATGNLTIPKAFVRSAGKEKRDLNVTTTTEGGFTVQTEVGELIPFLNPRLVTEALGATFFTGLSSNIDFPRNDADSTAVWEGENTANDETTPTFDRIQLSPNRLGAFTDISKQLLVQSTVDVENFVRNSLSVAIANALDTAAINGSGQSNQPTGILNTSGIGSVALGTDGGAISFKSIVDLETEVAAAKADFGNLAYLTTPGVRGYLKTAEKATGTAQFVYMDSTVPGEGMLNGYRARVSTLVPSSLTKGNGSNLHAVLFGNWSELIVAQWAGIDLVVDPYTSAKNALVTLVINSWWDIAVKHAASFAAIKDVDVTSGI